VQDLADSRSTWFGREPARSWGGKKRHTQYSDPTICNETKDRDCQAKRWREKKKSNGTHSEKKLADEKGKTFERGGYTKTEVNVMKKEEKGIRKVTRVRNTGRGRIVQCSNRQK